MGTVEVSPGTIGSRTLPLTGHRGSAARLLDFAAPA
ncbi:hypothetical protein J2805_004270 [Arthrobacter oryzae]|nr:hypothetical protein [Arthrobacter oryzae]